MHQNLTYFVVIETCGIFIGKYKLNYEVLFLPQKVTINVVNSLQHLMF